MKKKSKFDIALIFILPGILGFLFFYILPFVFSIKYAFLDKTVGGRFIGFNNFISLLQNKSYQRGLTNTLYFIGFCVPVNMLLSLIIALFLDKVKKGKSFFILIMLIPLVIPSASIVFFWKSLFASNGYLNHILAFFGMNKVSWLDSSLARLVVVIVFIWKNLGYNIVLFVAGLSNIPDECYEAAEMDGATNYQIFSKITLLFLVPTFFLVTIMSIINSFKVFKEIYLIADSNHPHESIYMLQHFMNNMFENLNYSKLTSATCILIFIIMLVIQLLFYFRKKVDI